MSRNDEKYMKSGSNIRHTSEDLFGHELDGSTSGQASTGLGHASGRAWIHSGIYNFDHFLGI